MKKICILGLGYIGLPTATMFANSGYEVVGVDVNENVIDTLKRGDIHIYEPGLHELVRKVIKNGNLSFSSKPEKADVFLITVPTPFREETAINSNGTEYKLADMRYVISAAETIQPHLQKGNLVILESTSPPGTTENLVKPILEKNGLKGGEDFYLAYSPERVLPGKILYELVNNARVVGGINQISGEKGRELYRAFVEGGIFISDATTAEMTKLMENTYRDVNIALANEFSRLAEQIGFNVWEAIRFANHHPRVNILNPGPGVGGHCISVDPWFLVEKAPDFTHLIYTSRKVNDSQPNYVVEQVRRLLGKNQNRKIGVLGLAYKPDVDDFRESPAIEVVKQLILKGYEVKAYDPFMRERNQDYIARSYQEVGQDADLLLVLVAHTDFKRLKASDILMMRQGQIFDACNCLDPVKWEKAGYKVYTLGKQAVLGNA